MAKSFSKILQDRGCKPEVADKAAKVIQREVNGSLSPRTPDEQAAVTAAWNQMGSAIASYGN